MSNDRHEDEKSSQRILAAFDRGTLRRRSHVDLDDGSIAAAAAVVPAPEPDADPVEMAATLADQVRTLDVLFAECAKRGARDFGSYRFYFEHYMGLALKAQAQCRQTAGQATALWKARRAEQAREAASSKNTQKFDEPTFGIRQNA
jgi:hypothetical protein